MKHKRYIIIRRLKSGTIWRRFTSFQPRVDAAKAHDFVKNQSFLDDYVYAMMEVVE